MKDACRPICKRVFRVTRAEDLPRVMERAFHLAQSGRQGPVLVDVPMDFFSSELPAGAFSKMPAPIARPAIDESQAREIAEALAGAERPVIYAGGGVHIARASEPLIAVAEALDVPVAHSLMGKGRLPDGHPLLLGTTGYWGQPVANEMRRLVSRRERRRHTVQNDKSRFTSIAARTLSQLTRSVEISASRHKEPSRFG